MSNLFKETRVPVPTSNATDRPKSDAAMDLWLKHHLAQIYGPVVEDHPISDDLLKRLEVCFG